MLFGYNKDLMDKMVGTVQADCNLSGATIGEWVAKNIPEGEVAVIMGLPGRGDAECYRDSFKAEMEKNPKLKLVAAVPGDWNRQKAFDQMQNLITSNPNLKAVFVQNEDMALGAIQALKQAGKEKEVAIVSQNGAPYGLESIAADGIKATVGWSPVPGSPARPAPCSWSRSAAPRSRRQADHHADDGHHQGQRQRRHPVGAHRGIDPGDPEAGPLEAASTTSPRAPVLIDISKSRRLQVGAGRRAPAPPCLTNSEDKGALMKVGIDSYCYHRYFGEVYGNQDEPPARHELRGLPEAGRRAQGGRGLPGNLLLREPRRVLPQGAERDHRRGHPGGRGGWGHPKGFEGGKEARGRGGPARSISGPAGSWAPRSCGWSALASTTATIRTVRRSSG